MKGKVNPYALPAVLLIADLARALRTSERSVRRHLSQGTFPIPPMSSPRAPIGLDKKYRWDRRDVEQFLDGGFRSFNTRNIRLQYSA